MTNVVVAWELGRNLGHLKRIESIGKALIERGAHVVAVLQDPARLNSADNAIACLPAPLPAVDPRDQIAYPASYAHLLHNHCFADEATATDTVQRWREIFARVKPDIVVCDHSPSALLAARIDGLPAVCVGTGFTCPRPVTPLPSWRVLPDAEQARLADDEQHVLDIVNRVLASYGKPNLEFLGQLYAPPVESVLLTYPELDHFGARVNVPYWGVPPAEAATALRWPDSDGQRVFAYLRPCPALPALCKEIRDRELNCVMYCPGLEEVARGQLSGGCLHIIDQPADLNSAASECNLFIGYGSHSTTATMLLAGKPVLLLPLWIEQYILSQLVCRIGAGCWASPAKPDAVVASLQSLLSDASYRENALKFARRYEPLDRPKILPKVANRIVSCAKSR